MKKYKLTHNKSLNSDSSYSSESNNQYLRRWTLGIVSSLALIILASCGTTAPLQQRDDALAAIERAGEVEAETYAQETYGEAQVSYDAGQELIVEDKKSGKNKKAKEAYANALESANSAYVTAIPLYTEAFIKETEAQLEEAKVEKVHRASEDLYDQAVNENTAAGTSLEEEAFEEAYANTFAARERLELAIAETRGLFAIVEAQNQTIDQLHEEAIQSKAKNAAPDEYDNVLVFIEDGESSAEEGYYGETIDIQEDAIDELRELLVLIEDKRQEALRELANADQTIEQIKEQRVSIEEEFDALNEEYQGN